METSEFIQRLPKTELHVHIEGCLTPNLVLTMGRRNGLEHDLPFHTVEEAEKAFRYNNLQEFLDLRDASLRVLITQRDFHEVTLSYLSAVADQNVRHTEIFFDPQVHTMRGVGFEVFMPGFIFGIRQAKQELQISAKLLMCFMTELGPEAADETLQQVLAEPTET